MKTLTHTIMHSIKKIFNILLFSFFTVLSKIKKHIISFYQLTKIDKVGDFVFFGDNAFIAGGKNITLGNNISFGKRGVLTAWETYQDQIFYPQIIIEDNVHIGDEFNISAINYIQISENVLCGRKITIIDHSHGNNTLAEVNISPINRPLYSKGPIIIKKNVWIGDKVTICPNVTIGENAIVGANSVVTKNIPSNSIVGGNPAKILRYITT